jgi:hypothetical protein
MLNHRWLWTQFLRRLSHFDPEYDFEIMQKCADAIGVHWVQVFDKMFAQSVRNAPRTVN